MINPNDIPASAKVIDAFDLSGRGTVVLCADIQGVVHIGDTASVGALAAPVTGIGMLNTRRLDAKSRYMIGVLIADWTKSDVLIHVGDRVAFARAKG